MTSSRMLLTVLLLILSDLQPFRYLLTHQRSHPIQANVRDRSICTPLDSVALPADFERVRASNGQVLQRGDGSAGCTRVSTNKHERRSQEAHLKRMEACSALGSSMSRRLLIEREGQQKQSRRQQDLHS